MEGLGAYVSYDHTLGGGMDPDGARSVDRCLLASAHLTLIAVRLMSACAMGAAIAGMPYTAMAAATFHHDPSSTTAEGTALDPALLALVIASVTGATLLLAFVSANVALSLL